MTSHEMVNLMRMFNYALYTCWGFPSKGRVSNINEIIKRHTSQSC